MEVSPSTWTAVCVQCCHDKLTQARQHLCFNLLAQKDLSVVQFLKFLNKLLLLGV